MIDGCGEGAESLPAVFVRTLVDIHLVPRRSEVLVESTECLEQTPAEVAFVGTLGGIEGQFCRLVVHADGG